MSKLCDGQCHGCKWCVVVDDDLEISKNFKAVFCKNPNNSMDKEWNPSQKQTIMSVPLYEKMVDTNNWTFIAGLLEKREIKSVKSVGGVEL